MARLDACESRFDCASAERGRYDEDPANCVWCGSGTRNLSSKLIDISSKSTRDPGLHAVIAVDLLPSSDFCPHRFCGQAHPLQVFDSLTYRNMELTGAQLQVAVLGMVESDARRTARIIQSDKVCPFVTQIVADENFVSIGDAFFDYPKC